MILTCPECTTRYRFDESKIPDQGAAVRCKRCRSVFRAYRPATAPLRATAAATKTGAKAKAVTPAAAHGTRASAASGTQATSARHSGPVPSLSVQPGSSATSVPISVGGLDSASDGDVKRLTRIILSDIVIYSPDRADKAIRDGKFPDVYRAEIEEGRKMIRMRFPSASSAVDIYEKCLNDLLETRRKELQQATTAL